MYQLGKYCSEGRRKRKLLKIKKTEKRREEEKKNFRRANRGMGYVHRRNRPYQVVDKDFKGNVSFKQLVRLCHISEPASAVMAILGKKYPSTPEEHEKCKLSLEETFDINRAGIRMKIPTPVTWENELSAKGNCAEQWEHLVLSKKLPFMAMLRNIKNMFVTGVPHEVHEEV